MSAVVVSLQDNRERLAQRLADKKRHPASQAAVAGQGERANGRVVIYPANRPKRNALMDSRFDETLADRVAAVGDVLLQRLTGEYFIDEFGFDRQFNDAIVRPWLRLLARWLRVEVSGTDNIPQAGAALVVANHGGALPLDALMMSIAVHDHHPAQRDLRLLACSSLFGLPVLGQVGRKIGHTMACPRDAHQLLTAGQLVGVFPESSRGPSKSRRNRYKVQAFGCDDIMATAVATKSPIVPCGIVGAEDSYPVMANIKPLARLMGLPYFPITPLFPLAGVAGCIPLPSKWRIAFGPLIETAGHDADDPAVHAALTAHVRQSVQQTLYRLLML